MTPQQTIDSEPVAPAGPSLTMAEWFQVNSRWVGVGAIVAVAAAAGIWYYMSSAKLKRENAERGLAQAKQSLAAGNAALAMSDLQKVVERYKSTPAGSEAALVLAQMDYDQGKYAEGLAVLHPYATRSASGENLGPIMSLIGDGLNETNKPGEAADAFRQAAEATPRPGERALYKAKQARALMTAGKDADARAVWQALRDDPDAGAMHSEAAIRLGELSVKPAGS
jgi:predicted negative regulator of RcsB-dependent stress response